MRPRRFTADNKDPTFQKIRALSPSMRPRRFTADNGADRVGAPALPRAFNEAAAFHRGQPGTPPSNSVHMPSLQ